MTFNSKSPKKSKKITVPCSINSGCLPTYESGGAAGADLTADIAATLKPGERKLIPTGLWLQIPSGYEAQIRPRSGLALKYGVTCLNSPGTIDSDYRGEVKVLLINLGSEEFNIKRGDRVAQLIFSRTVSADFTISSVLERSKRGAGGFGSTGL